MNKGGDMMYDYSKPDLNELMHYGVLGMKWGKRKKIESKEVTTARNKVSLEKDNYKKASQKYNKATVYGLLAPSQKTLNDFGKASDNLRYAKEDLSSTRILDKLKGKPKSNKQLELEKKYKMTGMSDNEAAVAAYKNIQTKKVVAIAGAVAITAAAAYAGYKIHDNYVDKIIKSGTTLQNISKDSEPVRDAFYTAQNKLDKTKYKGLLGANGYDVKKEIKVLSDIRQASPKNAQNVLKELMTKDPQFKSQFEDYLKQGNKLGGTYGKHYSKSLESISKGNVDKKLYEYFNAALVDHDPKMQGLTDKFYSSLQQKGYNAIRDVNDHKYSGYKSINPIIAFGSSGKVETISISKMADQEINRAKKIATASIAVPEIIKTGSAFTAAILGTKAVTDKALSVSRDKQIVKYRKKHPNTELTNTEIIRMLERKNRET